MRLLALLRFHLGKDPLDAFRRVLERLHLDPEPRTETVDDLAEIAGDLREGSDEHAVAVRQQHAVKIDIVVEQLADGSYVVTAILSGPGALGPRLGGRLGTAWASLFRRLHPAEDPEPARISFGVVRDLGPQVTITTSRHDLDGNRLEHWAREHLIGRIPGARRAPQ